MTRLLEILICLCLLVVAVPICAVTYFIVIATLGRPVVFRQSRAGTGGAPFDVIKFRTLTDDRDEHGVWLPDEVRLLPAGKFLRRPRFDELPQLFNVFKGEMSFIGPRPERPEFVEKLVREVPYYNQRHNVKPGLAGWAQLNYPYGASVEDSMEKLKFDLYYVKHQSLLLDILILIRTVEIVLFGKGR